MVVAPGEGDHQAVVGGGEGGAGGGAGGEGVLVEGPGDQGSEDALAGIRVEGRQEGDEGGDKGVRVEGQEGDEGGEDGGGGGAGGDGGRQLSAQAGSQVTLGEQAGATASADRGGQGTLLVGGEQGVRGGQRGHAGSCVVRCLYAERTRPACAFVPPCTSPCVLDAPYRPCACMRFLWFRGDIAPCSRQRRGPAGDEADDGASGSREHAGGEAERPDASASVGVVDAAFSSPIVGRRCVARRGHRSCG